jgi:hypothetical protein
MQNIEASETKYNSYSSEVKSKKRKKFQDCENINDKLVKYRDTNEIVLWIFKIFEACKCQSIFCVYPSTILAGT